MTSSSDIVATSLSPSDTPYFHFHLTSCVRHADH
ncbi:Protein of unknown function [Pyronema omphalodes CBS 100304]|uniref:Uncharacterized protein n=1 Tax=Pyronema omphalodes (strain CBS 100304) TaxID=1076935 RepID=U4LCG5_PYROM|nr:Protein of unknown function [Pyronema omphalodes CBS 100304]